MRNPRAGEAPFQLALQPQIFNQKIAVLLLRKPVRMPVLVIAKAKTVWMNFLTQSLLQSQSAIWNPKFQVQHYSSSAFFFLLSAPLSFDAALPAGVLLAFFSPADFFAAAFAFFSGASLTSGDASAASAFLARLARGAAAAPPRLALLLAAGATDVSFFPSLPGWSLESRIVT